MFEIEDIIQKKPVLLIKMHAEAKLKNVFNSIEMKGFYININNIKRNSMNNKKI